MQFSYVASHALKSPLRGISQLVTWISEDIDDKEATDEHLQLMGSRILRMENLLDDLLACARVGRGDEQFRKIDHGKIFELFQTLKTS
jgi:light-regulated signal transduction histidine kinase (bacteriophytochrome)